MNLSTRIALRYIFTMRSFHFITIISVISFLGIVIGVAALICVMSIFNGFRDFTEKQMIGYDPHLRILPKNGAWLNNTNEILSKLKNQSSISLSVPVLQGKVIIIKGSNMKVTVLNALKDQDTPFIEGYIKSNVIGKFRQKTDNSLPWLSLGAELAHNLKAFPGDTLLLMSLDMVEQSIMSYSLNGGINVRVSAIFHTNNPDYDVSYSFTDFDTGKLLFNSPENSSSSVDIKLKKIDETEKVKSELTAVFPETEILTWYDLHKDLYNIMKLERLGVFIVLSLIVVIAVFNVLASLAMTVVEKRSDIATLMALGATEKIIRKIYIKTGLIIGLMSSTIGTIIGLALCYGQINYGWIKLSSSKFLISTLPVKVDLFDVIIVFCMAIILSFIATIYPSGKAARTSIIKSLRIE